MASLRSLSLALLLTLSFAHAVSQAQSSEAPPKEPPYVDDNEFDPIQGEDPAATTSPIPQSSEPSSQVVAPRATPAPAATPAYSNESYSRAARPPDKSEKGVKLLHHPDAKKGLIRIEQDGTYVYKVKTQKSNETGLFKIGIMEPPNITSADGKHNFASMYGDSGMPTIMGEYEWQPFSKYGKLGVVLGLGFATAEGNGFFIDGSSEVPQEKYTFIAVPATLGVVYRLEYFKRQWIAPYVNGGVSYIGVAELRDDSKNHFTGTPGAYGAGGIMFNISSLDRSLAFNLSNEYGVANLWIVGEYRYQKSFTEDLDFTGGVISVGVAADF